jgi:spore germination protein YaaH
MRRRWLVLGAALVVALGATVLVLQQVRPTALPWHRSPLVAAGYLSGWDQDSASSLRTAVASGLTEVSPVRATVNPDGTLAVTPPPAAEQAALRQAGLRVIPTVQDIADGQWQGARVADLLADAATREQHVRAVVDAAVQGGWAGVDIDYENLPPLAGNAFTTFLTELRDRLHARGMVLSVAVPARTADSGSEDTLAYAYPLIGSIADEVRVMAYDYSYSTGSPGSVAPLAWVEAVVRYASHRVPKDKLMLGLATYGYDWVGRSGTDIGSAAAAALAAQEGVEPRWDARAASWTFSYERDGETHTVWFEDGRSAVAKADVAVRNGIRGVALWRLGGEDPRIWTTAVAAATGGKA